MPLILICDDDKTFHLAVKHSLKGKYECRSAYNGDEALAIVRAQKIDLVLLDIQMRTPDEGLVYIPRLKDADPDLMIVMASGTTDFRTVRDAIRLGAVDYIPKSFDPDDLEHTLELVLQRRALERKNDRLNFEAVASLRKQVLVGESTPARELRKKIERMRASPANVVITGETGTGKEVVARLLRKTLPDGSLEPFVAVDSATIQGSTAESQLFGHERGAFTGAEKMSKGVFEEADGGVVYFDEIANMPLEIQAKLLRVLQEKEITRLGSPKTIALEFRVICATNRNLDELVREGKFGRIMEVESGLWHSSDLNPEKPINWKRMVEFCGEYGCLGDLGMHALHLPLRFGWMPSTVAASLLKVVPTRPDGKGGTAPCQTWDNGTLQCRVPHADGYDFLKFTVDSVDKDTWSGEWLWQEATYPLTPGTHTLRWLYESGHLTARHVGKLAR